MDLDVSKVYNSTTLGPYSFQVFVAAAWTAKKLLKGVSISAGRRSVKVVEKARRKRPLASQIAKTAQGGVKKNIANMLRVDNSHPDQMTTRALRSGRRITL